MVKVTKGDQSLNGVCKVGNIINIPNGGTVWQVKNEAGLVAYEVVTSATGVGNIKVYYSDGTLKIALNPAGLTYFSNNFGISVGANTLDSSSIFGITTISKGFLPPRMTSAQKNAIGTPATGLMVYDTDLNKLCVFTGSSWETITSA